MTFRILLYAPILGIGGVIKVLNTDASMTWILGVAVALILLVILVLFKIAMPKFTKLQISDRPFESGYKGDPYRYSCDPGIQQGKIRGRPF